MRKSKIFSFLLCFTMIMTLMVGGIGSLAAWANTLIFQEQFNGATSNNFFTTGYRSLPGDSSKPMYINTGGTLSLSNNRLTLNGGRMTMGAKGSNSTTSSYTPGGVFDLSRPYRITIRIAQTGGDTSKKFQVTVDNNTTSGSSSIHGSSSRIYDESIRNITTGDLVIESNVGTRESFIGIRNESNSTVVIDEVKIEYLDGSGQPGNPENPGTEMLLYSAPNAPTNGAGTLANPIALTEAIKKIAPGGVIYLRGGQYRYSNQITIEHGNNGRAGQLKQMVAYGNEKPILNFSSQPYNSSDPSRNARGLQLDGNYWKIKGITFYGSADNGLFISGSNNIIEGCIAEANRDTGIQLGRRNSSLTNMRDWPSNNLILNSTSFNNADPDNYEDADGFAAKLTTGPGNVFDGCIAYNNVDDGWDLFTKSDTGPIGSVTIRNSIAFNNGITTSGVNSSGSDGNGFKLGGSGIAVDHLVENSIAFNNKAHGFTDNSNPGRITLIDCTSFDNSKASAGSKSNFDFARHSYSDNTFINLLSFTTTIGVTGSDKYRGTATSSVFYNSRKYYQITNQMRVDQANSSTRGTEIAPPTTSEFVSLAVPTNLKNIHETWRNADGSINIGNFLKLANNSRFKGIGVGGRDLGANLTR
ncbi:right-handed parallel beta-helix repeat-containing protein [Alkaliphilus transvaalensis]|uniref:right-handed parallel beta-helix repeat-containing protein n=1 Tax=Alkaliphilus transvaalensis TaxID=114628 RepID=UPI00068704E6|nr:right-handed parallel beta-helix repeat-containing protein [Alkaliphilus transvaalensis]